MTFEDRPADTSPRAWKAYLELMRNMSPSEKFARVFELSTLIRGLIEAEVRSARFATGKQRIARFGGLSCGRKPAALDRFDAGVVGDALAVCEDAIAERGEDVDRVGAIFGGGRVGCGRGLAFG